MMMFRQVKSALVQLLGDAAEGRFRVIGYQRQSKGSDETLGNDRMVQVYYSDGAFPKSSGRSKGTKTHDLTINIDCTASAKAKGNLAALESDTAPAYEKAAAIASIREAAEMADIQIDELIDAVFQILMDARNIDIGLPIGDVASRWIDHIQKDTIIERGDLIVKTANLKYSCRVQENVAGDIGVTPDPVVINSDNPVDENTGAGVLVENN